MIALSGIDDLEKNIPMEIQPKCDGKWKWLNTQTLVFEPIFNGSNRFPYSTTFNCKSIPNLVSVNGAKLEKEFTSTFSLPSVYAQRVHVSEDWDNPLQPLFLIEWNQKVALDKILLNLRFVENQGFFSFLKSSPHSVEMCSIGDPLVVTKKCGWKFYKKNMKNELLYENKYLLCQPKEKLKKNSKYTLEILESEQTYSLEGEDKSDKKITVSSFNTYKPFNFTECYPTWWYTFFFLNFVVF